MNNIEFMDMIKEVDEATLEEKEQVKRAAKLLLGNTKSVNRHTLIDAVSQPLKADGMLDEKDLLDRLHKADDGSYNIEEAIELFYTFAHLLPKGEQK